MYDLTQLEQVGFQFTPLEKAVFTHPSFQFLFRKGWPIKWGSLTTGLTAKVNLDKTLVSFNPVEGEKLTPNGSGTFFDDISGHIRSVSILIAKVARDASGDEFDQRLVQDLSIWFDGKITYPSRPFRWIEFEQKHVEKMEKNARATEVATLSQGNADVIVLLVDMLVVEQRERIRKAIEADCVKHKIFDEGDDQRDSRYYHLPWPRCMLGNESNEKSSGRHRENSGSIVLIDCGDVPTIIKGIPADVRRIVKPVRFKVPKSTFSDKSGYIGANLFPQFSIFLLGLLSEEERRKFQYELEKELNREQAEWIRHHGPGYYDKCQVIAPAGRQKLNALLLAGPSNSWGAWNYVLDKNKFWNELRISKRIRVDLVE